MSRGWSFEPCDISTLASKEGGQLPIEFQQVANDTISHDYIIKPKENSGHRGSHELAVGDHIHVPGGWYILSWWGKDKAVLYRRCFQTLLCGSFFWLVLTCILYNNTLITVLSSLSHSGKLSNLRGFVDIPKFIDNYSEVWMAVTGERNEGSLWRTSALDLWNLCGLWVVRVKIAFQRVLVNRRISYNESPLGKEVNANYLPSPCATLSKRKPSGFHVSCLFG